MKKKKRAGGFGRRWGRAKLVVFDCDGVFTDNFVYVDQNGNEMCRFFRSDGIGLEKLRVFGVRFLVLSKETNPIISVRMKKLKTEVYQGVDNKLRLLKKIITKLKIDRKNVVYVGNDTNDVECLGFVGMPVAVRDAFPEAVAAAGYRTKAAGGCGAVREVCDLIEHARL